MSARPVAPRTPWPPGHVVKRKRGLRGAGRGAQQCSLQMAQKIWPAFTQSAPSRPFHLPSAHLNSRRPAVLGEAVLREELWKPPTPHPQGTVGRS